MILAGQRRIKDAGCLLSSPSPSLWTLSTTFPFEVLRESFLYLVKRNWLGSCLSKFGLSAWRAVALDLIIRARCSLRRRQREECEEQERVVLFVCGYVVGLECILDQIPHGRSLVVGKRVDQTGARSAAPTPH
jgi:hypothetical protein